MSIFAYADVLNLFSKYCTRVMERLNRICYIYSIIIFTEQCKNNVIFAEKCNT